MNAPGPASHAAAVLRSRVLVPLGRVSRAPHIQLTSPLTRGGNFLYDWMWAFRNDSKRRPARVLHQPAMDDWLTEYPMLKHLTVAPGLVERVLSEFHGTHDDHIIRDFSRDELDSFCRALIADSAQFRSRLQAASDDIESGSVVINVRRGDYYHFDFLQEVYGLDIEGYVAAAFDAVLSSGRPYREAIVVSDDVEWCMRELPAIVPVPLRTARHRHSMFDDLAMLAQSHTTILANSTFSFWGAHIATTINPDATILAPPYHYVENGIRSRERFDPLWQIIDR